MNVVLYGATGNAGSRILTELLSRHHTVTAVTRDPAKLAGTVKAIAGDLNDPQAIAASIAGSDAVISAYGPPADDTDALLPVTRNLIEAVAQSKKTRLIVVGGAGSLFVTPGVTLLDSGHLPEPWRPIAASHGKALDLLKASSIDWTYFSPAAFFEPGQRTGIFLLGADDLITDDHGNSRISMEDYAVALVDELEKPAHIRERFTAGYSV